MQFYNFTFSHTGNKTGGTVSQYNEGKRDPMKQDGQMQGQGTHQQGGRGNRGGWMNRGNMRGRGRGRGGFRNQPGNAGAKPKNTLKFDNDYDFEQANTQFEELRYVLAPIARIFCSAWSCRIHFKYCLK